LRAVGNVALLEEDRFLVGFLHKLPAPPASAAKENGGGGAPPQRQNMPAAEGEAGGGTPPLRPDFGVNLDLFLIFCNPKFLILIAIVTFFIKNAFEMCNLVDKFGFF